MTNVTKSSDWPDLPLNIRTPEDVDRWVSAVAAKRKVAEKDARRIVETEIRPALAILPQVWDRVAARYLAHGLVYGDDLFFEAYLTASVIVTVAVDVRGNGGGVIVLGNFAWPESLNKRGLIYRLVNFAATFTNWIHDTKRHAATIERVKPFHVAGPPRAMANRVIVRYPKRNFGGGPAA